MKTIAFHNLGCKVNAYETEVMQQEFAAKGYKLVGFDEIADVYIVNTCSVTNIADRKSRQILHRARELNPEALVVAVGCYVQTRGEEEVLADGVDLVVGNNKKSQIVMLVEDKISAIEDISAEKIYEDMNLETTTEHTRCFIKIQDGCNQFCSYCIIPLSRGRVRSRQAESIYEEVRALAAKGYKEFVLTGIHLSSYGMDFADQALLDKNNWLVHNRLLEVIKGVADIEGVERIRLGSLEPRIITEAFVQGLCEIEEICPQFHLSMQSGCDETLKRMNRHYTSEEYYTGVEILRRLFKEKRDMEAAITTDVIVGFPGETEEEFEESRAFIERVQFYETHIFKYSKRKNTRAAVMENQLTEKQKSERAEILRRLHEKNKAAYINKLCEEKVQAELLVEEEVELMGEKYYVGFTREYVRAAFKCSENVTGAVVTGILCKSDLVESGQQICIMTDISVKSR